MNTRKNSPNFNEINSTLDKMIQLESSKNKISVYKVILLIAACVAGLIVVAALCFVFYKNKFSLESLISLLLAFFSIFIAIFFYFKAEDTSNRFYDTSYNFMKDVSVTLGKIEERFGEKLNNLNDKLSHLSNEHEEKKEELQNVEDEKQKMIDDLLDKAKLNEEEKKEYVARLKEKEDEADYLRHQLRAIDLRYRNMMRNRDMHYVPNEFVNDMLSPKEIDFLLHRHPSDWPIPLRRKMVNYDFMTPRGELTPKGKILFEGLRDNTFSQDE